MSQALNAIRFPVVGGLASIYLGMIVACKVLYQRKNRCWLLAIFVTGTLGLVGGLVAGVVLVRPRSDGGR